jgi:hypothetical protein
MIVIKFIGLQVDKTMKIKIDYLNDKIFIGFFSS